MMQCFKKSHRRETLKSFTKKLTTFFHYVNQRPIKLNVWYILVNYWKHLALINGIDWNQIAIKKQVGFATGFQVPDGSQWHNANNVFQAIDHYVFHTLKQSDLNRPQLRGVNVSVWFDDLNNQVSDQDQKLTSIVKKLQTLNDKCFDKIVNLVDNHHPVDRNFFNLVYFNQPIDDKLKIFLDSEKYLTKSLTIINQPVKPVDLGIITWSLLFRQLTTWFAYRHPEVAKWTIGVDPAETGQIKSLKQGETEASISAMLISVHHGDLNKTNPIDSEFEDYVEAFQMLTNYFVKKVNFKPLYEHYEKVVAKLP